MGFAYADDEPRVIVVEPAADVEPITVEREFAASVSTVPTATDALEAISSGDLDCLVTPQRLTDGSGLALLERVRERSEVPVVLAPWNGDESLASDAVAAGVTEYVPRDDDAAADALAGALERALETGHERAETKARARQFDAIFDDPETAAWVLAPDGHIRRANEAAREVMDSADGNERTFPELAWFDAVDGGETTVSQVLERALEERSVVRQELRRTMHDAGPQTLELSMRPVIDGETVTAVLVRMSDVTERARLEAELRESEELHRVTLNNMTDTILITDETGAFTYVCPNVHFIFGYSDDEIHEMGTIDTLLEPDLFDREELAAEGVLTNIECTATDQAGREHTLLVTVREVSIQDGTLLYSCRDITKRKRREEALTALHRTSQDLLYAETDHEIATAIVEASADVLDLDASAAFLFDTDENVLRPVAHSREMTALHGPLAPRRATRDSITGDVFVEGESHFYRDVQESPLFSNPTTDIKSVGIVPLGDHGVFLVGTDEPDAFDEVLCELTDLLATTAEAALDRVKRERGLRERDRTLKQRNRQLARLNRVNEIIREIDVALVRAETREEIERAVCDRLTTADRFSFAWIGAVNAGSDELVPRTRAETGRGSDYLDGVSLHLERDGDDVDDSHSEPAVRTARNREVTIVDNVATDLRDAAWRSEALAREYHSVISVPIAYDEFTYGVLTVYADRPDAIDEMTRAVLAELGEIVASAIAGIERKSALLSESSTRLEFDVADPGFVLSRLASHSECTLSVDGGVRQRETGVTIFATVEGASAGDVVRAADDLVAIEHAWVLGGDRTETTPDKSVGESDSNRGDDGNGATVVLALAGPSLASQLADHGAVLRHVEATPEHARLVVEVPHGVDERKTADVVSHTLADVTLRSKQSVERTTGRDMRSTLLERVTDRQLEVVQFAYYGGYFQSPREQSGEEIAETLDISPAAFYQHNRTVQRKLFELVFDEWGLPTVDE
ncbi:GAF domain-containing protein [Natronolimnobius sp. AArcel1]|uniref:bacterio-opsin activator domain-containing protein n=1 Tax=Natronolimnobius sp. AArcel1 TaxID=1679093 RepID=UPI0013E9BEDE|nr:bacterio-opsin activator domain-containing protein [Natronolimnobius sp. AArcel1]NGM67912.1 GAF domain-containing protein [Natronolimnobius sp. AArcel1]